MSTYFSLEELCFHYNNRRALKVAEQSLLKETVTTVVYHVNMICHCHCHTTSYTTSADFLLCSCHYLLWPQGSTDNKTLLVQIPYWLLFCCCFFYRRTASKKRISWRDAME